MKVNYLCTSLNTYRCKSESQRTQNASAPCVSLPIVMGPAPLRQTHISRLRFVCLFQKNKENTFLDPINFSRLFTWRWGTPGSWGNPPVHIISHLNLTTFNDRWGDPPHVTSPIWCPHLHVNRLLS